MNLQAYNKAWTGFIASAVGLIVVYFGLQLDPVVETGIVSLVTGFFVWLIPNR